MSNKHEISSTNLNLRRAFERILEAIVVALIVGMAVLVVLGVGFRRAGAALVWYDEVASILLAWLTYYGAALAALKKAHIGFPNLVANLPNPARWVALVIREFVVIVFLLVLTWAGWRVMDALHGTSMISLPWMPASLVQSVIPVGALLFIVAELLSLKERFPDPVRQEIAQ